jgi:hypothetical protein
VWGSQACLLIASSSRKLSKGLHCPTRLHEIDGDPFGQANEDPLKSARRFPFRRRDNFRIATIHPEARGFGWLACRATFAL